MRNVRMLTLTALLVVVLGLSACTVTLPTASAGLSTLNQQLGNLLPRANAPAQAAAHAVRGQRAAARAARDRYQRPANGVGAALHRGQPDGGQHPGHDGSRRGPDGTDPGLPDMPNLPVCRSSLTRIRPTDRALPSRCRRRRRWAPASSGTSRATSSPTTTWWMALRKSPSPSPTVLTLPAEVVGRDPGQRPGGDQGRCRARRTCARSRWRIPPRCRSASSRSPSATRLGWKAA